ncbi:MAG: arylesterase [Rubrivivax sp. SCN 71-131]|nr:MAG: arylesterase [Rubrivivax sp. SCN 71-131]
MQRQGRRGWLRDCSVLAAAALAAGTLAAQATTARKGDKRERVLLVVGDSLSAEYGIARGSGWAALLERRLIEQRLPWRVVNASVSGDTTAGGRSRLPALLQQHEPALVVIELGGNDALRGLPLSGTEDNLLAMARAAKASGARVLLVGMQVPPNYGRRYAEDFEQIFARVARVEKLPLVPRLLAGVADAPDPIALFQPDRIHPTAQAHPRLLDNVWPALQALLR